jgi:hypothetical protein
MPALALGQGETVTADTLRLQQSGLPHASARSLDETLSRMNRVSAPVTTLMYKVGRVCKGRGLTLADGLSMITNSPHLPIHHFLYWRLGTCTNEASEGFVPRQLNLAATGPSMSLAFQLLHRQLMRPMRTRSGRGGSKLQVEHWPVCQRVASTTPRPQRHLLSSRLQQVVWEVRSLKARGEGKRGRQYIRHTPEPLLSCCCSHG